MEELVHKGDLVMVTNRYEAQMCAIDYGAACLVVCMDSAVPQKLIDRAADMDCAVIQTPYDTYAAARLVSMAAPVRFFMKTKELLSYIDVLVDGPFIMAEKDVTLLFKGSSNQRTIDVQKSLQAGHIIQWDPGEDTTISHTAHL